MHTQLFFFLSKIVFQSAGVTLKMKLKSPKFITSFPSTNNVSVLD